CYHRKQIANSGASGSRCFRGEFRILRMNDPTSGVFAIDCKAAAALMEPLTDLVVQAGNAILAANRRAMKVEAKLDGSPVTEADLAADCIIFDGLARLAPHVP